MNTEKRKIEANLEYLKKLFIMPDSPDKFIEFGHELLEMIHDFFKEKGGIHSSITLPELSRIFDETAVPDDAQRARHFDRLRKDYPERREFPYTTVTVKGGGSTLRRKLAGLGFVASS